MRLVIDRKEWYRGQGAKDSRMLRREDDLKCCLGILALACGYSLEQIRGTDSPRVLAVREEEKATAKKENNKERVPQLAIPMRFLLTREAGYGAHISESAVTVNSFDAVMLMDINDNEDIDDEEREQDLTAVFARNDIQVEFIG